MRVTRRLALRELYPVAHISLLDSDGAVEEREGCVAARGGRHSMIRPPRDSARPPRISTLVQVLTGMHVRETHTRAERRANTL